MDNLERKNDTLEACQAVNELHIEELQKSRISEQNINVSPNKDSSDWYGLRPQEIGQKMDNILNSSFSPSPMRVSVFGSPKFEPTTHPPTAPGLSPSMLKESVFSRPFESTKPPKESNIQPQDLTYFKYPAPNIGIHASIKFITKHRDYAAMNSRWTVPHLSSFRY